MFTEPKTVGITITDEKGNKVETRIFLDSLLATKSYVSLIPYTSNPLVNAPKDFIDTFFIRSKKSNHFDRYVNGTLVADFGDSSVKSDTAKVKQIIIRPNKVGDEFTMRGVDLQTELGQQYLGQYTGNWLNNQLPLFEIDLFKKLVNSANDVQTSLIKSDASATTIEKGAHFDTTTTLTDVNSAKNLFLSAIKTFNIMGLPKALTKYDRENEFVSGISTPQITAYIDNDMYKAISSEILNTTADQAYNDLFKNGNLELFQGIQIIRVSTLPVGVKAIFLATGTLSPYVHQSFANGLDIRVTNGINNPRDQRVTIEYDYQQSVIMPENIIVLASSDYKDDENKTDETTKYDEPSAASQSSARAEEAKQKAEEANELAKQAKQEAKQNN